MEYEVSHLLPQAIFGKLNIPGLDINSSEFGWFLDVREHRGKAIGLHPQGWNADWLDFLKDNPKPSKECVLAHLKVLKGKFASTFAKGVHAKSVVSSINYAKWLGYRGSLRKIASEKVAERLALFGLKMTAKRAASKAPKSLSKSLGVITSLTIGGAFNYSSYGATEATVRTGIEAIPFGSGATFAYDLFAPQVPEADIEIEWNDIIQSGTLENEVLLNTMGNNLNDLMIPLRPSDGFLPVLSY